ncbi:hypothetical protein RFI_36957 [Reticulomyxa filosa]|uniref:Uncharacterized protein n=1 Tax=Reticulomyxa filosa TaxID=46433 RepID=X6LFZ5_RETFI|nr:hypothetical protein RFI_36957 [Reticulomyxa filosa]|eukprot:ETO00484.1 hypothetical protein RFI_36957 [Reticulomyxa filosa]
MNKDKTSSSLFFAIGICKEIYSLRLDYWKKGGRLETPSFKLPADESIQNFATMQKAMENIIRQMKKVCRRLRENLTSTWHISQ